MSIQRYMLALIFVAVLVGCSGSAQKAADQITSETPADSGTEQTTIIISEPTQTTPPPPASGVATIEYFRSNTSTIEQGETANLQWKVVGADTVNIDPDVGPVDLEGERSVKPAETTTYTLSIRKGEVISKIMLTIGVAAPPSPPKLDAPPSIELFTVAPSNLVLEGSSVTIHWSVFNADSVTISQQDGDPIVVKELTGSREFTVLDSTWFVLSAQNKTKEKTAALRA